MRPLTIIIPAAGDSQRFRDAEIYTPKPLIKFTWQGARRTMLEHARGDLSQEWPTLVGCQPRDVKVFRTVLEFKYNLVPISNSGGQAESVLRMLAHAPDGEVLVVNCDQGFSPGVLPRFVQAARDAQISQRWTICAALCFESSDPRYGYVDQYEAPWFLRAVEKIPLGGGLAVAGAFWFQDARILARTIQDQLNCEYPVNYLTNTMDLIQPARGKLSVKMDREELHTWGTPEELFYSDAEDLDVYVHESLMRYVPTRRETMKETK